MYLRALAVFLLAFIAGGECCCEPTEYSKDFIILVMGRVPVGPPSEQQMANVSARFSSSVNVNWNEPAFAISVNGTLMIPTGPGQSMPVPVAAKAGIVKDGAQTKIWGQVNSPMLPPNTCKILTVNGDFPESLRCIPKTYQKITDNIYQLKAPPFIRRLLSVDDSCSVLTSTTSVKIPQNKIMMYVEMATTRTELSAGYIDNQVPDNCESYAELPRNMIEEASASGGASIISSVMGAQGPTAARRSVLHDVAKRTLDEFMKRENQKRQVKENFRSLTRSLRSAFDHIFK